MSGQSTPADVSLFQWVWRTYVRQALVPLLLVELVLLGVYLVTHEWSRRENTAALREVVAAEIDRLAARQSTVIDQQLMQVSVLTDALRRQAVRAMSSPPARREDPKRYAVSSGGALYAVNDGGVGVLYSSLVKRGPAELERLARSASLDPALIDVKESSPLIVQTYFNTYDSINRIWPWMDASTQYPQDMDIPKYNFYYEADAVHNPARKVVWTDAYLDPAGQGWMVSAIAPVYTGDFLEGVVGLDITLDRVVSTVLDTDLPWDGFGLLVAEDGTILALPPAAESVFALRALDKGKYSDVREDTLKPDAFNLFRSAALQPLGKLIGTRSEGRGELRLNGNHLAAWSAIPSTGWRLVVLVSEEQVLAPAQKLADELSVIGWVMLVGLVGFYAVFFTLLYFRARAVSLQIAEPLAQIRGMAQSLAGGTFETPSIKLAVREFRETVGELARTGENLGEANRARLSAEKGLKQRNRELSTIFSLSPDGLVSFDAAGRLTEANPAFANMTGLEPDALAGISREAFWERIGERTTTPVQARGPGQWQRLTLLRPQPRVLECTTVRPSETTEAGAEVVYFRDVTAVVELNRVKAQFVATAAHELRTPVAVILGYAELLQSSHPQPRDQDMMLSTIQRHGKHVAGLINEMLDLATLDARGGRDLELVDQPLVPVVREGVESFRLPGDPRIASFSTEGEVAGRVRIDRAKFRQALDNVLSNAFKYSTADKLVRVRVQGRSAEGRAQLGVAIIDQGPGMDVATQAQVFERFFRAEDVSSTVPGTGLGMSIVKEIMELHGGQVEIDSAPGRGTTVTLWLQSVP